MRICIFVSLFLLLSYASLAQKKEIDSLSSGKVSVKIIDWGQKVYMTTQNAWNKAKEQLIEQLGEDGFEKVKKYSDNRNIPGALLQWDGNVNHKKVPLDEYIKRCNSLKELHKVASYSYDYKERKFNYAIIGVPYQVLYWDRSAKWDTVYFLIRAEAVEEL